MGDGSTARVLVVFETQWDRKQLAACWSRWGERLAIVYAHPTQASCPPDFDVRAFVDRIVHGSMGRVDGVLTSSSRPGATAAAAIASRLALCGAGRLLAQALGASAEPEAPAAARSGYRATVEGFAYEDSVKFLGIVDTVLDAPDGRPLRFDYPSSLPAHVQAGMLDATRRSLKSLALDRSFFHADLLWDEVDDRIDVLDMHPAICGQFADLYQKVDGNNTYELALALCLGDRPRPLRRQGRHGIASSVPLRVYAPTHVVRAADASDVAAAEALFPDSLIWTECAAGDVLVANARRPLRYAVLNVGAPDPEALRDRLQTIEERLGFELRAE